jgi:predicted P-loop ATPase
MNLTPGDYAALERSWLTPAIVDTAGLYRVDSLDGRDLVGRKGAGNYAGIVFPYRWPESPDILLYRLRLDSPPVERATGRPRYRYLTAAGERNRLYFPACDLALVTDVSVPVIITEGEKKGLSLWRAALESNGTGKPAFLPIAVAGVWTWRGSTGRVPTADGKHIPEKGAIPDFDRIPWTGRKVTILFDTDATTNGMVRAARAGLARELTERGAETWIAEVPALAGVKGVDDLLALYGLEKALGALQSARRYEWRNELILSDNGKILPVLANAITTLRSAPEWRDVLAFNEHALNISTTRDAPWGPVEKWADHHTYLLVNWLQRHGLLVSITDANAAVEAVARDRSHHPVRDYLDSLEWDRTSRIGNWLKVYLGATATEDSLAKLIRAIGARWLISAVARVYEPGCQADHVLILEHLQGEGKSTALRILGEPFFSDDIAELGTKDASLATVGVWIVELPELDAMTRAEVSKIKAFVSRRTDRFRPPYGRRMIEAHRQCVFAGSVNHSEYLKDETGGRRFWPVECGRIDLDALRRDKDQLWAEAKARYRNEEPWWLDTPNLIQAAAEEQEARYLADPWEGLIAEYLDKIHKDASRPDEVTTTELLQGPLNKKAGDLTRADQTRVGAILRRCAWKPISRPRDGGTRSRIYGPTGPT